MQGSPRSAYAEIIGSISDMRFCRDGRHMISRDYMSIKLWDINMESKPVAIIPMHEHLRSRVGSQTHIYIKWLSHHGLERSTFTLWRVTWLHDIAVFKIFSNSNSLLSDLMAISIRAIEGSVIGKIKLYGHCASTRQISSLRNTICSSSHSADYRLVIASRWQSSGICRVDLKPTSNFLKPLMLNKILPMYLILGPKRKTSSAS